MIWTIEKLNTTGRPTTSAQAAGDAENEETNKCSDEINDAQRAE